MRKSPAFTLTAVLTLALGIGATTAIFTLVNAVLLRSLPVKNPAGLLRIGDNEQCCVDGGLPTYGTTPNDWSLFSYRLYQDFREHTPELASLAAFQAQNTQMAVRRAGSNHPAQPLFGVFVSGNAFSTLGIRAYAGRLLHASDDHTGAPPVAVMSYQAWQGKYGGNPNVIGSSFLVNGVPVTIVGIAPPGFYGARLSANPASFWFPIHLMTQLEPQQDLVHHPELNWLNLLGRLAPGASVAAAQAHMIVELKQFLASPVSRMTGPNRTLIPRQYLRITPGGGGVQRMQQNYKSDLHLLMWISSFVLLIACANLANLLLARSVSRRQQVSVRMALGAPRRRLVQRALIESLVLAVVGGLAGILLAWAGAHFILHLAFQDQPANIIQASPSWPVLGFAFGVSLLTGLLFGVAPAWFAAHADPIEALRGANRSTSRRSLFLQKSLVIGQAGVSVVLLCSAGLLILSLNKLEHQDFGFKTTHRYIVNIDPATAGYKPQQLTAFYQQLHDSLAAIPGVARVSFSVSSPLDGDNWNEQVAVEGQPPPAAGSSKYIAGFDRVSPGYFKTIGTRLVDGRLFRQSDNQTGRPVAIVNQTFVKDILNGKSAIGMHFGDLGRNYAGMYEIVGVVKDAKYQSSTAPTRPMYFLPADQWVALPKSDPDAALFAHFVDLSHYLGSIQIQTHGYVPGLEAKVQHALADINPNLMTIQFQTLGTQVRQSVSQQSMIVKLTSLFGLLALVLAAIGLYGVTAYAVAQRTTEIGVRMALGANRTNVQKMILRGAFLQTGVGLLFGIPAAILGGHLMAANLFGISAFNPLVLGSTIAVLAAATLLAALVPAYRAASIDPMRALRSE
jgi:predicted permease